MTSKSTNRWDFNPNSLSIPYLLIIPGVFVLSGAIGIIAGDYVKWGGLVLDTAFIFGFFVNSSRPYLQRQQFWILTACLLTLHLAVFIAVLLHVTVWKLLWFMVMVLELPVFSRLRDRLLFR
jgi:hypothetical protein